MHPVDDIDLKLIELLEDDGRTSYSDLARSIGVSEGTVRNRIKRLVDDGILRIVGIANPHRLGSVSSAMICVRVRAGNLKDVLGVLGGRHEVRYLAQCVGGFDVIVLAMFRNSEHMADFLEQIVWRLEGVIDVRTFVVLRVFKRAGQPFELVAGSAQGSEPERAGVQ